MRKKKTFVNNNFFHETRRTLQQIWINKMKMHFNIVCVWVCMLLEHTHTQTYMRKMTNRKLLIFCMKWYIFFYYKSKQKKKIHNTRKDMKKTYQSLLLVSFAYTGLLFFYIFFYKNVISLLIFHLLYYLYEVIEMFYFVMWKQEMEKEKKNMRQWFSSLISFVIIC